MKTQENMKRLLNGIPRGDLARKPVREHCTPELLGCGEAHEPPSATPATLGQFGREQRRPSVAQSRCSPRSGGFVFCRCSSDRSVTEVYYEQGLCAAASTSLPENWRFDSPCRCVYAKTGTQVPSHRVPENQLSQEKYTNGGDELQTEFLGRKWPI